MQLGRGTQLVKMDLSNAYRIIPIHPDDQSLLEVSWRGATYIDRALPLELRSVLSCLGYFIFLCTGEFTCPSSQAYTPSMLSLSGIQVNDRHHPLYLRVALRQSKRTCLGCEYPFMLVQLVASSVQ